MFTLNINGEEVRVYEYKDAETLILSLSEEFKDDITAISRGGRNRNRKYYYNYCCSFDIETSTINSGYYGYYHEDGRPLGVPYLFQFNIYGSVIMCRYIEEAADIFKWLGKYFIGHSNRVLVIFDHNLGYEYGFFKDIWELSYWECFALDIHHPVTLKLKNGLVIRDSYKMCNMSLETLSKDWSKKYIKKPEIMDYKRIRFPWSDLDEDTLVYSALDVLSLSDGITEYLAAHDTGPWTKSPTSTSFIRADYKKVIGMGVKQRSKEQKQYFKLLDKCKITPDIYSMLLRQARGGNTHANRRITGQFIGSPEGSGVAHFDITSSYPTQMVCYPEYPVHYWRPLDLDAKIEDIMKLEAHGYCTLFDVVLVEPRLKDGVTVPYLAVSKCRTLKGRSDYSDNGRYISGAEMLETTIYGIEWPIIAKQYEYSDIVVLRGYYARKGYLPDILRNFILKLYANKTELKGVEGKEVEYSLSKTYVNGVYGMSFTQILRIMCKFDVQGIYEAEPPDPEKELARFQSSGSYFLCYAWGSMVATLGRVYLQKMIDACGDDFLYCDTDSVFVKNPEEARKKIAALEADIKEYQRKCGLPLTYYDIKGKPHELGGIDEEPECSFMTYGAKKYITVEDGAVHCTIAGVPKKAGSKIIGSPDNFKLGMVFKGSETNKMCLWYNDDEGITIRDGEHELRIKSNIAMLPVDYILGISNDYTTCLQIEGLNPIYHYTQDQINMNEEYI